LPNGRSGRTPRRLLKRRWLLGRLVLAGHGLRVASDVLGPCRFAGRAQDHRRRRLNGVDIGLSHGGWELTEHLRDVSRFDRWRDRRFVPATVGGVGGLAGSQVGSSAREVEVRARLLEFLPPRSLGPAPVASSSTSQW